jgi:hypothetical protein
VSFVASVCIVCGKAGCRCAAGPGNKRRWAAAKSLDQAARATATDRDVIVLGTGKDEDFDTIWGDDPDWQEAK